jgi:hypothetical protein
MSSFNEAFIRSDKQGFALLRGGCRAAGRLTASLAALLAAASAAEAGVNYNVTINDPGGRYTGYYSAIRSNIKAAGATWSKYVLGSGNIEIAVQFSGNPTMSGWSSTSAYAGTNGAYSVFEQGVAAELRSGVDPNGTAPDAVIQIGGSYLVNNLWFDPDPIRRIAAVPTNKTDAESAFLHEFAHILGFSGWRDPWSGALPGNYESTFDRGVVAMNGGLYFTGVQARARYGGPVPLTRGNYEHFGNAGGAGAGLAGDLMNGIAFYNGQRYWISPLDLAVIADTGMPLASNAYANAVAPRPAALPGPAEVPEPSTLALLAVGAVAGGALRLRLRHAPAATPA